LARSIARKPKFGTRSLQKLDRPGAGNERLNSVTDLPALLRILCYLTSGNRQPCRPAASELAATLFCSRRRQGTCHIKHCKSVITQSGKKTISSEHENPLPASVERRKGVWGLAWFCSLYPIAARERLRSPGSSGGGESTFATVRLRRRVTNGPGSRAAGIATAFELIESAQARWRAVSAPHLVALVRAGARFENGQLVERADGSASRVTGRP
jgi:hypothetical protein